MQEALYPLLLQPSLHTKVWGGRKLATVLHKPLPTDAPYGESWELHDTATVANGPLAGRTLGDLLGEYGTALVGQGNDPTAGFPLLAKFLDAADWLSVQVHPNDEQAAELEGEPRGKSEAWIFLGADDGAKLVVGVQPGTTREAMAQAIRDGVLEQHIAYADVNTGDVLFLKANTVHALGPGLLIYEIQQSSNTTYRLYDWNRMGLDGKPRDLHIDKGVQVANVDFLPALTHPWDTAQDRVTLVTCPYFQTDLHTLQDGSPIDIATGGKFHALTCVRGTATVASSGTEVAISIGQTALIPASLPAFSLVGTAEVLQSWQT